MPRRTVEQIYEGKWTRWDRNDRFQCCDCCLTHEMEWRIRDGQLELKMYRNNRSTAAYRRANGIKVITNGAHRNGRGNERK